MLRRKLAAACLCLCLFSLALSQTKTDVRRDGFKGPVATVRVEQSVITKQNGEYVEGPRVLLATQTYAQDLSWSEFVYYEANGSPARRYTATYNADGDKTGTATFNGDGSLVRKVSYVYKDRRLMEEEYFNADGSVQQKRVLIYEGTASLKEVDTYDGQGSLIKREVKTRDPQHGDRDIWTTYKPDGSKDQERVFSLKTEGAKKSEFTEYNSNGATARKTVSTADAERGRTVKSEYNGGKIQSRTSETREFDSYGNLLKLTTNKWDEKTGKFEPMTVSYYTITYY